MRTTERLAAPLSGDGAGQSHRPWCMKSPSAGRSCQMTESVVLETRELTVQFGGLLALCDVSIDCHRGQLTGLIGPNGAGKTTLIDAVTGFVRATGQVFLEGEEISALPPHRRAHRGLTRTWQSMELFDDISVRANLEVASRRLTFAG